MSLLRKDALTGEKIIPCSPKDSSIVFPGSNWKSLSPEAKSKTLFLQLPDFAIKQS